MKDVRKPTAVNYQGRSSGVSFKMPNEIAKGTINQNAAMALRLIENLSAIRYT
jgi:hypothetical protein